MAFGFEFQERVGGTFYFLSQPTVDLVIRMTFKVSLNGVLRFAKDKLLDMNGEIYAEGFADHRPVAGTIAFRVHDERRLPYDFSFVANDGKRYRVRGQKDFAAYRVMDSLTTLHASLLNEAEEEIGRATFKFDANAEWFSLLQSFRLRADFRAPGDHALPRLPRGGSV